MSDYKWHENAPEAPSHLAPRYYPIIQTVSIDGKGVLFSEDLDAGKPVTAALGRKAVEGRDLGILTVQLLAHRERWVSEDGQTRSWEAGRPGDGWRSHVQALVIGKTGKIAILTGKGMVGGSLMDVINVAKETQRIAYRETGHPFALCAFWMEVMAGAVISAGKGASTFVPYHAQRKGGPRVSEGYAGHMDYLAALDAYKRENVDSWVSEWTK